MVIRQGEIYWVDFGEPIGSMPGFERPCVIVQNNVFNASGIVEKQQLNCIARLVEPCDWGSTRHGYSAAPTSRREQKFLAVALQSNAIPVNLPLS